MLHPNSPAAPPADCARSRRQSARNHSSDHVLILGSAKPAPSRAACVRPAPGPTQPGPDGAGEL